MCTIGAFKFYRVNRVTQILLDRAVKVAEWRGYDAIGLVAINKNGQIISLKKPCRSSDILDLVEYEEFKSRLSDGDLVIISSRAQPLTEVASSDKLSIQPIVINRFVISHNGVVANDSYITDMYKLEAKTKIDSEVIVQLLIKKLKNSVEETLQNIMSELSGGYAFVIADTEDVDKLYVVKDFKTLVYTYIPENCVIFISEEAQLKAITEGFANDVVINEVEPYTINTVQFVPFKIIRLPFYTKNISYLPPKNDKKVLVCASGGIDSSTAAAVCKKLMGYDVVMVHFNYGQKSEKMEWLAVQKVAEQLKVECLLYDIRFISEFGQSVLTSKRLEIPQAYKENIKSTICWVPFRNGVFIASLVALAEALGCGYITAGWTLEEEGSYPDNSILFFKYFNRLIDYGSLTRPKLIMPLQRLMKPEICYLGHYLGLDYTNTWSCDNGLVEGHCGECGACYLHHYSLLKGIGKDPTRYAGELRFPYKPPFEVQKLELSIDKLKERLVWTPF